MHFIIFIDGLVALVLSYFGILIFEAVRMFLYLEEKYGEGATVDMDKYEIAEKLQAWLYEEEI